MKLRPRILVSSLISGILMCSTISCFGAEDPDNSRAPLQGRAAAFGVLSDQIQNKLGFKCTTNQYEDVLISDVRPGTAAADTTLETGDRILDAQVDGDALQITIERNGQVFKARLRERLKGAPALVVQKPKMDATQVKPFNLNAEMNVTQDNVLVPEKPALANKVPQSTGLRINRFNLEADKNFKMLADYNLELIVDRSMSMRKPDCPGGLSRWEWVGQQSASLAQSLAPYVPNGLTIIPFATEYDVFEHASAQNINTLFNGIGLQFGTRLFEPLAERLDNYFAHWKPTSKPLLIVVITDGVPFPRFEPALVKNELIEASQKMKSPEQVTVIFCQIGDQDRFGKRYLTDLDQNLTNDGARYHFIHTISFDDLQATGLGPALVATMKEYAPIKAAEIPKVKAKPPAALAHSNSPTARDHR
jgi:hypothetical protein